jgi:pimeloyl-ACP methyl ester carboxylesterase
MIRAEVQYLDVGSGERQRRIAYQSCPPADPGGVGLLWLIGLKSDMESTKATALADWARARGLGFTRFDYSGHGRSEGRFEDATISDWLEETVAVFCRVTEGPQIVVGSSTGAHIALLLVRHLLGTDPSEAERIKSLVLIAPAWDLTEELMWKVFPEEARRKILETGVWHRPSAYDETGYAITRRFIEDGRKHLFAGKPFNPGRPVHIVQGLKDVDVPPAHARELLSFLEGGWGAITEIADGEHRLSRPEDIAVLFKVIEAQVKRIVT